MGSVKLKFIHWKKFNLKNASYPAMPFLLCRYRYRYDANSEEEKLSIQGDGATRQNPISLFGSIGKKAGIPSAL